MRSRKYISLIYDGETQQKLREYCFENGFDITKDWEGREIDPSSFEFHTTIFYTTSRHNLTPQDIEFECDILPIGFDVFGEETDVPVLQVEHPRLRQLRKTFEEVYKMKDIWGEYRPHVSLSYNWTKTDAIIPLPDFRLNTSYLKIKDIV